ncbi:hypothetical protein ACFFF5_19225 [Lederbergia wuyishanensis]|uniref:Uncharacterized protein n=1 Tax=Lederbergia wuyishanensis TaxID=1347903 RepID=A0ABU0D5B9_9BACI|nr:hypothetical protein [Lederbergia wuyishanensis]MCJ8009854.1 hypothetical protein [Lederbergia wuyishanensis]MDQ0343609.1 hypothetical protein [Lederbergia wuyishanensis]
MGVACTCGVEVNAFSADNNVKFTGQNGTTKGDLTYLADVCVNSLETSTLSLQFVDTETGANSFTFTANAITSVTCKKEGQNCVVTVDGTGLVNGVQFPFEAVFRDEVATAAKDNVQSFVITGFFDQNGAAPVPQGSIVAVGCN